MSSSTGDKIMKAGIVVIIAHIIFKITGLVQNAVIGHFYSETQTDAYVLAFEGILFMIFLIGEESIGPAFLPVFLEEKNKRSEKSAWRFAKGLLTLQTILLLLLAAFLLFNSSLIIKLLNFSSGKSFACSDDKSRFARTLIKYMAPGLIGLSLGTTTYMILNGFKRFFWAAFGDALAKISVIVSILLFKNISPVVALGIGFAVGGFAKLSGHVWGMRDKIRDLVSAKTVIQSKAFRKFLVLIAPLILGILFAKFRDTVNNILILNYPDNDGLLTANSWGMKFFKAAGWFVPYGVSIAMFPYFCDMIDRDDRKALGTFITDASKILLLFFVPVTAGGVILSRPIISLIYEHGKFALTDWTAVANQCYFLVLPFYSLEFFLMQGFFADRRTVTPTVLGIVCSSVSVSISFCAVVLFQVHDVYGPVYAIAAVALGYTFSRALKVFLLVFFLKKKIPAFKNSDFGSFLLKLLIITAGTGAGAYFVRELFGNIAGTEGGLDRIMLAVQILTSTGAGGAAFLALVYILKVKEFKTAVFWALKKIKRREKSDDTRDQGPASVSEEQHEDS